MAARFWVAGSGNWDASTTTHWSTTSGGAGGAAVPTTSDTVTFDANSGSATITGTATMNCSTFTSSSSLNTFAPGSNTINVNGGSTSWAWTAGTFTAGTSTITMSGAGVTFAGGSKTYGTLQLTGSGTAIITGTNTFATLTRTGTAAKTDRLLVASGVTTTVTGTFTANGNSATNRLFILGWASGVANSFNVATTISAATVTVTNTDFADITAAGAGNWNLSAITGKSGDAGGNTGITFTNAATQTWSGTTGGNWSANAWTTRVPLPQDNVAISSAFSASQTVTADMPRLGNNIDFTGTTGNPAFDINSGGSIIFGSLTMISGMTQTATSGNLAMWNRTGTTTLTSAGVSFGAQLLTNVAGTSIQLADNFTGTNTSVTGSIQVNIGTFDFNSKTVSLSTIAILGTLNIGSSASITLTGTADNLFGLWGISGGTVTNGAGSTITISNTSTSTRTFAGSGFTYGTLTYTVAGSTGALTISGSNTFDTINFSDVTNARTLTITKSTTQTINTSFNVNGTSGKLMTINTNTAGTAATLTGVGNEVNNCVYVSIKDSTATGGAGWFADPNSTNVSGNTGWVFNASGIYQSQSSVTSESQILLETSFPNVSDSGSLTESIKPEINNFISVSDSSTLTESLKLLNEENPNISDSISISESLKLLNGQNPVVSDSIIASENIQLLITDFINISDSTTISENITLNNIEFANVSDSSVTSESLSHYSDQVDTNENINITLVDTVNVSDNTTTSENIQLSAGFTISVSDSSTLTESIILLITFLFVNVNDSSTTNESILLLDTEGIGDLDTVITSENISLLIPTLFITINDSISISENVIVNSTGATVIDVIDTVITSESLSHYSDQVDINERIVIIALPPDLLVSISDNITTSESVQIVRHYSLNTSDSTVTSEFVDVIRNSTRDISLVDNRILDEAGNPIQDESGGYITDETPGGDIVVVSSVNSENINFFFVDLDLTVKETVIISENMKTYLSIDFLEVESFIIVVPNPIVFNSIVIPAAISINMVVE